jgi:hypothetical protein
MAAFCSNAPPFAIATHGIHESLIQSLTLAFGGKRTAFWQELLH